MPYGQYSNMVMGHLHTFQVTDTSCQTDLENLTQSDVYFNKRRPIEQSDLTECHSFFQDNTLAEEDSPVYVERSTLTAESGGLSVNKYIDNPVCSSELDTAKFCVFTENRISETINNSAFSQTLLSTKIIPFQLTVISIRFIV